MELQKLTLASDAADYFVKIYYSLALSLGTLSSVCWLLALRRHHMGVAAA